MADRSDRLLGGGPGGLELPAWVRHKRTKVASLGVLTLVAVLGCSGATDDRSEPPPAAPPILDSEQPEPVPGVQDESNEPASARFFYQHHEDVLPVRPYADTLSFDSLALREIARLDTTVSPAAWLGRFPADSLARFQQASGEVWDNYAPKEGEPCARALRRIPLADGRVASRVVLFYPPAGTSWDALPPVRDTLGLDLSACRMGAVWIRTKVAAPPLWKASAADSLRIRQALAGVRPPVTRRMGSPVQMGGSFQPHSVDFPGGTFWRAGETRAFLEFSDFYNDAELGIWTSFSAIRIAPWQPKSARTPPDDGPLLQLVASAGMDDALADSLLDLAWSASRALGDTARSGAEVNVMVRTMERWLEGTESLPAPRRATSLLVADQALSRTLASLDPGEWDLAAPAEALGADYREAPGRVYVYMNNWLRHAYELAPPGPVRDRAFLALLRLGFGPSGCSHDEAAFREVIERGERFLKERPSSPLAPEAALEVAHAYADIVGIARETDELVSGWVRGAPLEGEVPAARRAALRHYRRAFDGQTDEAKKAAIWREAWRLAAGMPPLRVVHVRICD